MILGCYILYLNNLLISIEALFLFGTLFGFTSSVFLLFTFSKLRKEMLHFVKNHNFCKRILRFIRIIMTLLILGLTCGALFGTATLFDSINFSFWVMYILSQVFEYCFLGYTIRLVQSILCSQILLLRGRMTN